MCVAAASQVSPSLCTHPFGGFHAQSWSATLQLLVDTGRIPEAAFMARTYMPSLMSGVVALWKEDLAKVSTRAAQALADPGEYPNLFPDLEVALEVEAYFKQNRDAPPCASGTASPPKTS